MVENILNYCIKKGFFLDKEMLNIFKSMNDIQNKKIIDIISNIKLNEKVITKKVIIKNKSKIEPILNKNKIRI
jgi:hypothetical protein